MTNKYIIYRHTTAGAIVLPAPGKEVHRWVWLQEENEAKHNRNMWGIWGSQREWEDAEWIAKAPAVASEASRAIIDSTGEQIVTCTNLVYLSKS
jgi:hypothetical protein